MQLFESNRTTELREGEIEGNSREEYEPADVAEKALVRFAAATAGA
jgi:hypothetical protein